MIDAETLLGEFIERMPKNVGAIPGKTGIKGKPVLDPSSKEKPEEHEAVRTNKNFRMKGGEREWS